MDADIGFTKDIVKKLQGNIFCLDVYERKRYCFQVILL